MKKICMICNSEHCPEANMDYDKEYTPNNAGCCICYNKTMSQQDEEEIDLCSSCEKYADAYDSPEIKAVDMYNFDTEGY